ncbi:phosphatase [Desulforamulus aeronauticus]|uniref:Exopolyphosphatase / guanosine-5'-triphosphate,3'-diphosphate pyrophosphatase n=1 Tax=Desulforamulus aeronauticus DSM 10349 TaxID=1121421 RepID=A0A1M6RSS3_9FIRM|nr:phosphatase [Desulforamulus aeronauticus]SHK35485.1 exopolyphosphatase / guanosine-5'-triphosphate,3'-diphosphate pyrophosphatase [Desulforamulus aeronauticus DSM 10349]
MLLASIDIGTNSTRYLLAEVTDCTVETIKSGLITTRLGQGINGGELLPEAMERTIIAIEQFLTEIKPLQPRELLAVATSAVRDAVNQEEFLQRVQQRTGITVQVLSGEAEAAASYRGVLAGLAVEASTTMVLDVGGGSTEMIWPVGQGIEFVSLPAGAVRMTEGGHSEEQIKQLLLPTLQRVRSSQGQKRSLVAVGGTATTLAAMSLGLAKYRPELVHGHYLPYVEVVRLLDVLEAAGYEGRKNIVGLQPERADIIIAGATLVKIALEVLQLKGLTISESDILQGLVVTMYQKLSK